MSSPIQNLRVAFIWNGSVFDEKTFTQMSEPVVTVGDAMSNMFIVPAAGLPDVFHMFERTSDGYVVRFTNKVEGTLSINDEDLDLEEAIEGKQATRRESATTEAGAAEVYEARLSNGDWGLIELGEVEVYFQVIDEIPLVPRRGVWVEVMASLLLLGICVMTTVAAGLFLLFAFMSYDPDAQLSDIMAEDRFAKFLAEDLKEPLPEEEEVPEPEEDTTGKKAGGEEGKFGAEDSEIEESKIPKVDGEMVDKIDVKNLGVNKALNSQLLGAGPLKDIFASDSEGFDSKMNVAMSGEGGELVVGRGAGGMGMRGTGKGGGGEGFGRIGGLGKVDTGGGKGAGGKIGKKGPAKVRTKVSVGTPQVGDFCDKNNIRQVVSAKQNAIKYCFEKELQTKPTLAGKIMAQWNVSLDGSVMKPSIASSSMNDAAVEGCIVRVIERMRFQPPNGGICIIQYPFVFSGLDE